MLIEPLTVVEVVEIRTPLWATLPATMVILPCGDEIVPLLMTLPGDVDAKKALGTLGLAAFGFGRTTKPRVKESPVVSRTSLPPRSSVWPEGVLIAPSFLTAGASSSTSPPG